MGLLSCKGKQPTEGRIAAREKAAAAPARKTRARKERRAVPVSRPHSRSKKRKVETVTLPIPSGFTAEVIGRAISELKGYRERIDATIAKLEALA